MFKISAVVIGAVALSAFAQADLVTLSASINVDNVFDAYLSTSPTSLGVDPAFLSGNNWQQTMQGSIGINAPGTYYLHVRAVDQGPPAMFIGQFSLSNANAKFVMTGTQSLLTEANTFTASTGANPGDVAQPVVDEGLNGGGAWGNISGIDPTAHFLWAGNPLVEAGVPVYFTTQINVVPEPVTLIALSAGALSLVRRRRRS